MPKISIRELLEAGFHFGHQTKRWNPKMKQYIHSTRNAVHIINLQKTVTMMRDACDVVRDCAASGGLVLFVGTKRQAVEMVAAEAKRGRQHFVNHRWPGGTLTNWTTIQGSIKKLKSIEKMATDGTFEALTKKEVQGLERTRTKIERALGGIKDMERRPDLMIVVDTNKENIAVAEAIKLKIPVVALVDTNCNPDVVDYIVPGNDDAIRSLRLFLQKMADAALEGRQVAQARAAAERDGGDAESATGEEMVAVQE